MHLMSNPIQQYQWGSRTAIASLTGRPVPSPQPEAEMWIGAHPENSSWVMVGADERRLSDLISADPCHAIGASAQDRFGPRLPFLLKVLAAAAPLSLQAHPTKEQATRGFADEEARRIPIDAAHRSYRDRSDKPELICALTDFRALCGFRSVQQILEILTALDVRGLDPIVGRLTRSSAADGIRGVFVSIMEMPPAELGQLLPDVLRACASQMHGTSPYAGDFRVAVELAERYDRDPGVLLSLLMNHVLLHPGQGLFVPAGTLHAYLSGTGVEIMANSDNVLRGGLTAKHVDLPQLKQVLRFEPFVIEVQCGSGRPSGEQVFLSPAPEFRLSRWELTGQQHDITYPGTQIIFVVEGAARLTDGDGPALTLVAGQSAWIPSTQTSVRLSGNGLVFRATDGLATVAPVQLPVPLTERWAS